MHDYVPRKRLEASPQVVSFDSIDVGDHSDAEIVTVSNSGNRPIKIKAVRKAGEITVSHNAPKILFPGQSFKVSVALSPKVLGPKTGSVFFDTDANEGIDYISITGFGYGEGMEIDPDAVTRQEFDDLEDRVTVIESRLGSGPNPEDPEHIYEGLTAYLTNESHIVVATTNGVVLDYAGAQGQFIIFLMDDIVSEFFTFSTVANPQNLDIAWVGNTYRVTGGLDVNEDQASVTFRATGKVGTGYANIIVDKVFSLAKAKGGANAKTLYLISDRQTVYTDQDGNPQPPGQTITFTVMRQNTTAPAMYSVTDINGAARDPVTNFLSSGSGDVVTMTVNQFNAARGETTGVIVTATITDGDVVIQDKVSVVRVRAGSTGESGVDGFDGTDGIWKEFVYLRAPNQPPRPTGSGIPAGWSDDPYSDGTDNPLWMSQSRQELDGTLVAGTSWSIPIIFNGPKGEDAIGYIQESNPGTPGSPHQFWYKPSTKQQFYWNGTQWVQSTGNLALFDQVLSDHIGARQVLANHVTTTNLITSSAQIGDGMIRNAQIGNLEVTNAKIGNLEIDTGKVTSGAITNMWSWTDSGYVYITQNDVTTVFMSHTFTVPAGGFQAGTFFLTALIQHGIMNGGNVSGAYGLDHTVRWRVTPPNNVPENIIIRTLKDADANMHEYAVQRVYENMAAGTWTVYADITVYSGANVEQYRVNNSSTALLGFRR